MSSEARVQLASYVELKNSAIKDYIIKIKQLVMFSNFVPIVGADSSPFALPADNSEVSFATPAKTRVTGTAEASVGLCNLE